MIERFEGKTHPEPNSGCWLWSAGYSGSGYGVFYIGRKHVLAHRHAWSLYRGPIPDGMSICHKCDTPACVNPQHLFLGTPKDNTADMIAKGRHAGERAAPLKPAKGERNGNSKITAEVVRAIYHSPLSQKKAAKAFGVAQSWVWRIRRREVWRHVLEPGNG